MLGRIELAGGCVDGVIDPDVKLGTTPGDVVFAVASLGFISF
jgi:hypothetical protein